MPRTTLTVTLRKTGIVDIASVQIARHPINLDGGSGYFDADEGETYWLFWQLEGAEGGAVDITVQAPDGSRRLEVTRDDTEIPQQLGRNAGTNSFKA